jgi:hypothetical protein
VRPTSSNLDCQLKDVAAQLDYGSRTDRARYSDSPTAHDCVAFQRLARTYARLAPLNILAAFFEVRTAWVPQRHGDRLVPTDVRATPASRVEACELPQRSRLWSGSALTSRDQAGGRDQDSVQRGVTHNWVATPPQVPPLLLAPAQHAQSYCRFDED